MASGASMFLSLLILIHRSHAQMEVRVQIFADNTCTGTATADHQVPFSFGGQGQGTTLTAATCSVLPAAHSTALGVAAGSYMGFAGECTSDENKFAFYCTGTTKSECEASLVDKEGKGDSEMTNQAAILCLPATLRGVVRRRDPRSRLTRCPVRPRWWKKPSQRQGIRRQTAPARVPRSLRRLTADVWP